MPARWVGGPDNPGHRRQPGAIRPTSVAAGERALGTPEYRAWIGRRWLSNPHLPPVHPVGTAAMRLSIGESRRQAQVMSTVGRASPDIPRAESP